MKIIPEWIFNNILEAIYLYKYIKGLIIKNKFNSMQI